MRGSRFLKVLTVGVAAAALFLTGCSGGGSSGSQDGGAESLTGDPIVIGTICSCTGPTSSSTGVVPEVWEAWAQWTNENGGINGHPVEVIVKDDGLDAAKAVQLAKELIEVDNVMAIVGELSNLDGLWADYARDAGVPVIGASVFSSVFETNPMFFPTGAQTPTQGYGALSEVEKLGATKVALMACAEAPTCVDNAAMIEDLTELFGDVTVVSNQTIAADAPNYVAPCLAARDAGADVIIPLVAPAVVHRVVASCQQQGYDPALVTNSFVPGNDWVGDPGLDGFVTVSPNQSIWDSSTPATAAFNDALDKFAPGIRDRAEFNASNSSLWAAAEVFKLAAERAEIRPDATAEDVLKGLYTFEDETLDGLTPPLTFTEGEAVPPLVACWYVTHIENGEWVATNGAEANCIPDEHRQAVFDAFVQA